MSQFLFAPCDRGGPDRSAAAKVCQHHSPDRWNLVQSGEGDGRKV